MKQDNEITQDQRMNSDGNKASADQSGGKVNNSGKQTGDNTIKDPDNWTTGEEPMTGAQSSYLNTLASEAGEEVAEDLTKAEASKKIDELQHKTGRGLKNEEN